MLMPEYAQTLTYLFALGIVGMHVVLVAALLYRVVNGTWIPAILVPCLQKWGLALAATLPVTSFFLSLWYSEIIGIPVCPLCWFARTLMYPLAVILPLAALRRDVSVVPYVLALSGLGVVLTGYHHLYQMGLASGSACAVLSGGGECATRYVFEFGYVTLPLIGCTVFLMIALLVWLARPSREGK